MKTKRRSIQLPIEVHDVVTKLAAAPPRPMKTVTYLIGLIRAAAKRNRLRKRSRVRGK